MPDPTPVPRLQPSDVSLAHALVRVGLGVNIAMHGLVRLPDLPGFAAGLEADFADTFLPGALVYASGYGIVFAETVIGTLLVLGLFLRPVLAAGTALMIVLIFGTCLLQNWGTAGSQLVYLGIYGLLLGSAGFDRFSLDGKRAAGRGGRRRFGRWEKRRTGRLLD